MFGGIFGGWIFGIYLGNFIGQLWVMQCFVVVFEVYRKGLHKNYYFWRVDFWQTNGWNLAGDRWLFIDYFFVYLGVFVR